MEDNCMVEISTKDEFIEITVLEDWTLEYAQKVVDLIKKITTEKGINRVLLNLMNWDTPESEVVRFYSGKYLAEHTLGIAKISAFTNAKIINRFGELVATNRGAVFRIFEKRETALQWLLDGYVSKSYPE